MLQEYSDVHVIYTGCTSNRLVRWALCGRLLYASGPVSCSQDVCSHIGSALCAARSLIVSSPCIIPPASCTETEPAQPNVLTPTIHEPRPYCPRRRAHVVLVDGYTFMCVMASFPPLDSPCHRSPYLPDRYRAIVGSLSRKLAESQDMSADGLWLSRHCHGSELSAGTLVSSQ